MSLQKILKYRMYRRYKTNLWGKVIPNLKIESLVQKPIIDILEKDFSKKDISKPIIKPFLKYRKKITLQKGRLQQYYGDHWNKKDKKSVLNSSVYKTRGLFQVELKLYSLIYRVNFLYNYEDCISFIKKGFVLVNGKKITDPFIILKPKDIVQVISELRPYLRILFFHKKGITIPLKENTNQIMNKFYNRIYSLDQAIKELNIKPTLSRNLIRHIYHLSYIETSYKLFTFILLEKPMSFQIPYPFYVEYHQQEKYLFHILFNKVYPYFDKTYYKLIR